VLKDKEGNMWFGSDGQGIFRYSGGPFISLDRSFGLPDNQIIGITGDEQRTIYFACYSGNICSYSLGEKVSNLDIKELGSAMVSCIAYQQGAGLWIAARGRGLYLYRNGRASYFPLNARESGALSISSLYTDRRNRLWVVMGPELVYLDQGKQTVVPLDGLTADCIAQVGEDSILIASNNGLLLYNGQALQPMVTGQLPDSLHIQCMTERDGKWILGTGDQGIVIYDTHSSKSTVFNKRNGLSSDFIYNIVTDSNGNIMAGTGLGISRISFDEAGRAAVMNYGKANGVAGLESNANAVFATPSGQIWFGTTEGACCYIPSARTIAAAPISIVLESVKLFGGKDIDPAYYTRQAGWYHIPDELELPYQHNNISLSFQAITLSPADKILYRYKLKGTETPWSEWSPENAVTFSALDPGTYTFVVECSINGRKEHTAPLQYTFCIKTPFHKSVWFVLSILGLCTLLGVYLQYSANKRKQNRIKREQALRREEQTRVRERTAEDFHDEVGNKLTRINVLTNILKAKMAPGNQDADRIIKQIQDNTQQLYSGTRDILWSLQSSNDNLYEIVNHVRDLAGELYSDTEINFSLSGNEPALKDIKMPLDKSRNFIMIWKEALNNALKYARAHHIHMAVVQEEHGFICVSLADDGAGFDEQTIKYGNGLKNMRARAERMGGQLDISTIENRGTKITLRFPYS
jgi:signal transduction histidine kinase